jgi:radical SAM superfamily enzyme YgiQ (UPF0313 family)
MIKKNRILLIEPPFFRLYKNSYSLNRIPFGLAYLAGSIIEKTNWDVKVYNADFVPSINRIKVSYLANKGFKKYLKNLNDLTIPIWKQVQHTIEEFNPDIVGISVKSPTFISARNVASIAKEFNKDIKVIMGGPYPTMAGESILDDPNIDISVVGEGEITITEILYAIETGCNLDNILGIIFRRENKIIRNKKRGFINDLDQLEFPHIIAKKVLIDYEQYPLNAFKNLFTIRGCPYDCEFCASKEIWTKKVRFRSAENVRQEIEGLMKLGINRIHFDDDTFGINKKYIFELCTQIITYCYGIKWSCEIRVDLIDDAIVALMKKAGCEIIQMGIESGSNEILSRTKKNITVEDALIACKIIKKYDIELQTFFLVGLPYETENTLKLTVNIMKKCKPDKIIYSIFTPYPYTQLFNYCKENGLIDQNYDPTLFNHQSPKNCFSLFIEPKRFRKLAGRIERKVDRHNLYSMIKSLFHLKGFIRVQSVILASILKPQKKNNQKYIIEETQPEFLNS